MIAKLDFHVQVDYHHETVFYFHINTFFSIVYARSFTISEMKLKRKYDIFEQFFGVRITTRWLLATFFFKFTTLSLQAAFIDK